MTVLALIGLVVALGGVVLVLVLLHRIVRPLREIRRYTDEINRTAQGIARNLEQPDELERTRTLLRRMEAYVS